MSDTPIYDQLLWERMKAKLGLIRRDMGPVITSMRQVGEAAQKAAVTMGMLRVELDDTPVERQLLRETHIPMTNPDLDHQELLDAAQEWSHRRSTSAEDPDAVRP